MVDDQSYPMADGSTGQIFTSKFVAESVAGNFTGQTFGGECYGSGSTDTEGVYSGNVACTIQVTAADAYTIMAARDSADGADFVVTGGKGKFKGATGRGHYTYDWFDDAGDKLTWTMNTAINLR